MHTSLSLSIYKFSVGNAQSLKVLFGTLAGCEPPEELALACRDDFCGLSTPMPAVALGLVLNLHSQKNALRIAFQSYPLHYY